MIKRTFTVVDFPHNGKTYGRYHSKTPKGAAQKAFSSLSRKIDLKNTNDKNFLVFTMKETTKNSLNKKYKYIGTRVELAEPIEKIIDGKLITYKYRNIITNYDNFLKK